jgi:hypothetical protein
VEQNGARNAPNGGLGATKVATLIESPRQAPRRQNGDGPNPRHMECAHLARNLAHISQPELLVGDPDTRRCTVTGFARQLGLGLHPRPAAPSSDGRPPATSPD